MGGKGRFPRRGTSAYRLLGLVAVCGEFPASLTARLPGSKDYMEAVVTGLKKEGFLKVYYRDKLRGFRLGRRAKAALLADSPGRFGFYLTGNTDTSRFRGEVPRRLRLHRSAEVHVAMVNAGVAVFRDEKPPVFAPGDGPDAAPDIPAFYGSREVKEMGIDAVKVRGSRMIGVLIAPPGIFAVYNSGPYMVEWDYRAEVRAQVFLKVVLCCQRLPSRYRQDEVSGLLFSDGLEAFYQLISGGDSASRCFFLLDGNYGHFYYFTNDHRGEVLLRLLCDPELRMGLDRTLMQGLYEGDAGFSIENDAMDADGAPVLFGYFLDIPRISRFRNALRIQGRKGTLVCFDFQREVLERFCGGEVEFSVISFEKFERRFFP